MNRLVFLWLIWTVLPSCWGNENEYDYEVTATPDYDYNSTFEYDFINNSIHDYGQYEIRFPLDAAPTGSTVKASAIGQLTLLGLTIAYVCH